MRVLVLGAAGMMGHMACRVLSAEHEVFGTVRSARPPAVLSEILDEEHLLRDVDVMQMHSLIRVMGDVRPDVVFNCVGIVKQLATAHDAILSTGCNALLPHQLSELCRATGAHLIHMSTDCVFSGEKGMYTLDDNPDPVDLYGRTKLVGELAGPDATTLRTSIVGRQLTGTTSLFEWARSQRGKQVFGFQHAIYSGLTTRALAEVVARLLRDGRPLPGLWQVASEPIDKLDLLRRLNDRLHLDLTIGINDEFRCDRSLDGSAFVAETGIVTPGWDEMLDAFAADEAFYAQSGS